jgi:membrane protease YdiL (CAAX protease family)
MSEIGNQSWGWPLIMSYIRLPLILICDAAIVFALRKAGFPIGMPIGALFATLSVTAVNFLCLGLLQWRARVEGFQLAGMVGFQRSRILRDLFHGVLWSILLFALLMGGILAVMVAGKIFINLSLEQVFLGDEDFSSINLPQWMTAIYAMIAGVIFPLLNAPVEELQYRGYAQSRLIAATRSVWIGIILPAIGFGLQHIAFGFTLYAGIMYSAGFFLWGIGAGIIAHRQGRLLPLIFAHFISNLSFGIIPMYFILRGE